ncbi:MAG: plasma-membrane proton-efflux P-type ATPase [Promethearchaeati archaeon SRVP18_Atabeyarchaeia-1]
MGSTVNRGRSLESATIDVTLKSVETSLDGLSGREAKERLLKFGLNEVKEKKTNPLSLFLRRFWGPTAWMLETVAVVSFLLNQVFTLYLVVGLLVLNAAIGSSEESRSGKAVELLRKKLYVNSRILRDGEWALKPSREIVPGDIILVRIGDIIPADVKLVEGRILVDESSLTGESLPVEKEACGFAYAGSIVRKGEAKSVVVSTGSKTFYGNTITLVKGAKARSHVEELIGDVVRYVLLIVAIVAVCVVGFSFLVGLEFGAMLNFVLMLLVSSVPIALPVMFTVTMSVGALRLYKKGVLVTRITAVEDAATMTTICADKTGTITENMLSVTEPVSLGDFHQEDVALFAMLASEEASQDPIDIAALEYAKSLGVRVEKYRVRSFTPFDPATKRTEALVEKPDGHLIRIVKGAPQMIIEIADSDDATKKIHGQVVERLSTSGYRVIAVAVEDNGRWSLVGFMPLQDRPRKDSRKLIAELRDLGIDVKMVTGDGARVAVTVAREVGIAGSACKLYTSGERMNRAAGECDVFAEVFPEDKLKIVRSFQSAHRIVGMTGDGVNDVPALKQAEVGVALQNAADAAKAAASVVLTSEGLSGIVELVKTGREAFQRMYTWILNRIVKTFQISIFLSITFFMLRMLVTTTIHLVLLLFLIDFITISIATDNVKPSAYPDRWEVGKMTKVALAISTVVLLEMFIGLSLALRFFELDVGALYTFVFYMLLVSGVANMLVVRERRSFWTSRPGRALSAALVLDTVFATALCLVGIRGALVPIPLEAVLAVSLLAAVMIFPKDYVKRKILARD